MGEWSQKCIRPSVTLGDAGTNEDDLTIVFSEIVDVNRKLCDTTLVLTFCLFSSADE